MNSFQLTPAQWLTKPDGDLLGFISDGRVVATAAGAIVGAVIEKELWVSNRSAFGVASMTNGKLVFFAPDETGNASTTPAPQLGTNRHLARLGLVAACVAGIEYIPNGHAQYALLGLAAVATAHIIQDLFPAQLR